MSPLFHERVCYNPGVAAARGIPVSVIVPARNNFPFFSLLHAYYHRRYAPLGIRIHRYHGHGGMTHLKALVGGGVAVPGSSNFSMNFLEESALVTRNPGLVAELRARVFAWDMIASTE